MQFIVYLLWLFVLQFSYAIQDMLFNPNQGLFGEVDCLSTLIDYFTDTNFFRFVWFFRDKKAVAIAMVGGSIGVLDSEGEVVHGESVWSFE